MLSKMKATMGAKVVNTELLCLYMQVWMDLNRYEKVPLLLTGKSEKPRCFKHIKVLAIYMET
jgi:hypothetical protein